ncbi:microsomal signal peptidase 12 kDa subunit [Eremomyces bilateralis CBS 781.70]|uniref:Signal peptidase complex subunit 1 n=1 Tax=Eremomyces bilateralis CBS 781.70 TaxID=1392243 RepID=A0A6G1G1P1_9PEZI|nr:microsomal signal peptidase 12 kDa subunit [Eremomyces bilateralis CBS 781.70]KAF1811902.1 microsomal signal peptidase 12 kDa subunit [Eremomyces bilateralis CBS 781.70]
MADEVVEKVRELLEGQIDFEGQRLAELMQYAFLTTVGAIAFIYGYVTQNVYNSAYIGLGGTALTMLLVVPPWPFFNKHPVRWLSPHIGASPISISVDGKKMS